jgi:DnaK suppressor protein
MPVRARKTVGAKRRKRRTAAAKPATARKKPAAKRRRKTARATTMGGRRRRRRAAPKTAVKRPRRRARRKPAATRRRAATRRKPARVKKKPGKSKTAKKTAESSGIRVNRKPRALKKTIQAPTTTEVIWPSKKEQRQAESDSQATPIIEQSLESKMAEAKKSKKRRVKVSLKKAIEEPVSIKVEADLNISPYKEQPGEDYMNVEQLAHFRRLLLQQKRVLLEHMGRTVHHLQDDGVALADISDRATQEEEFNLELRASDRERKLIKKIDNSLQQLDEKNYGYCNSCGVEIGIRRLEARPTANLCIDCKTLDEIREKQIGG